MIDTANPIALSAVEAAEAIAEGHLSAEEYITACLERIEAIDGQVQAFVHLDRQDALMQARALDERRRNGQPIGMLHGLPVAIKDIFDTADYPTECGSPLLAGRRPVRDSTVVARLRSAGAVIIGKTVTTEFAYFHPGPTRNPHNLEHTPGGSSSGSAAAVAAGMVPLAVGSQTNGSVIRPASYCGVYGCKPSHGLISRARVLQLSRTLDHVGVFARTLPDTALILEALAGYDPLDEDTRPVAAPDFLDRVTEGPPMPPRFAFVRTPVWDRADEDARQAIEQLVARLGDAADAVEMPESYLAAWDDHRLIMAAEMAHNLGPAIARGGEQASKVFRDLVVEGRAVGATQYLASRANVRRYNAGLEEIFKEYDAIVTLATTGTAPKADVTGNPVFCSFWTLTGLPALSLPLLQGSNGLPLGIQLIGQADDDARLLRSANWLINRLA